jgi:S1-C subfamily serine protease
MLYFAFIVIFFILYYLSYQKNAVTLAKITKESTVKIKGFFKEKDLILNDKFNWYGSGVIIDKKNDFYVILTNLHLIGFYEIYDSDLLTPEIEQYSLEIKTAGTNDWIKVSKILVNSKLKDFALIYIKAKDVKSEHPILSLTTNQTLQGTKVYAMGHPSGLNFTFTSGIISAFRKTKSYLGASYQLIQTDTAANPGNSGGPLIDDKGRLVGIMVSKVSKKGIEGLNFAIPAQEIITSIKQKEFVEFPLEPKLIGNFVEKLKQN